jgi:hypothetical protein
MPIVAPGGSGPAFAPGVEPFGQGRIAQGDDRRRQQAGVLRPRDTDGQGADRDPTRHLHN